MRDYSGPRFHARHHRAPPRGYRAEGCAWCDLLTAAETLGRLVPEMPDEVAREALRVYLADVSRGAAWAAVLMGTWHGREVLREVES